MKSIHDIGQASTQVLECRSMGHAWSHLDDEDIQYRAGRVVSFRRVEQCLRCDTERWREVNLAKNEVTRRGMRYADGYLLAPGAQPAKRLDAIRTLYTR